MIVRGICISDRMPSCMRAPPEAGTTISAASLLDGEPRRGEHRLADRDPHRAAHEGEIEGGDDRRHGRRSGPCATTTASLLGAERRLPLPQPLGVALAVAEPQRVDRYFRQLDPLERAVVEQHLEARARCRCGNGGRNCGRHRDWPRARGETASARSPGICARDCPAPSLRVSARIFGRTKLVSQFISTAISADRQARRSAPRRMSPLR